MDRVSLPSRPHDNRLFAALPPTEAARLLPVLEPVTWALRDVLYSPDETPEFLYFPTTAMVSLVHMLRDGVTVEMGVVGREGVVGVALFMGGGSTASEALVQSAGHGFRLPAVYVGGSFDAEGASKKSSCAMPRPYSRRLARRRCATRAIRSCSGCVGGCC